MLEGEIDGGLGSAIGLSDSIMGYSIIRVWSQEQQRKGDGATCAARRYSSWAIHGSRTLPSKGRTVSQYYHGSGYLLGKRKLKRESRSCAKRAESISVPNACLIFVGTGAKHINGSRYDMRPSSENIDPIRLKTVVVNAIGNRQLLQELSGGRQALVSPSPALT